MWYSAIGWMYLIRRRSLIIQVELYLTENREYGAKEIMSDAYSKTEYAGDYTRW